jgi:glycosyltransferase involved in cell wall biosynthesis
MTALRSLVITVGLPYPPFSGRDLRNWQNICGLSSFSRVGVFGLSFDKRSCGVTPPANLEFWRRSTSAALTYPASKQINPARAWPFDPMGHPADGYYSERVACEVEEILDSFNPDTVVIEGLSLYRYIETIRQFDSRTVLDCHNVEARLYQEIADSSHGDHLPARLIRELLPARTKLIEQKATQSVDQIWVCSDDDAALVKDLYGTSTPVHVVPNGVDVSSYGITRSTGCDRLETSNRRDKTLIFPAAFKWEPNAVASSFLIHEFFPRLSAVFPDCQLLLAGSSPTVQMMKAAEGDPRIVITGEVPDMRPYLAAAAAMVVPLFQGGGTRFKILEAFAANVPVISTAKGAEGLAVQDGKHLLFAETAEEFVDAVQRLWTDEHLANRLAANGLELVKQSYSMPVITQQISNAIHQLRSTD